LARERRVQEVTAEMTRQADVVRAGEAELARRADALAVLREPSRHELQRREDARLSRKHALGRVAASLRAATRFKHRELEGETLVAERLSEGEGADLHELLRRRLGVAFGDPVEPLSDEEELEYERLLGKAAGDERLFERKRAEAAAKAKAREMAKEMRRLPQSESLLGAVFSDPQLFDLVHERLRENLTYIDEYGRERKATATERILEPEHVAALYLVVSLIAENGGREIGLTQHGAVRGRRAEDRLPFVDVKLLAQLRRNGLITTRRQGSEIIVAPGERVRRIAKKWAIVLPEATA
jgi:hypothetical protein